MAAVREPAKTGSESYIFVYGTLRSAPNHEMNKVLERYADRVGRGRVPGILYDVGRYPGVVRTPGTRAFVWGDVYRLRSPDRALKILDRYEGWDEEKPRSAEFRRSRVAVDLGDRKKIQAWIYLYNRPTTGLPRIRSGDYFKRTRVSGSASRPPARSGSRGH
jgi:gamma-glutamylcyclotransferase (GGCT)/AIG2-like uncharacterized protein YtfP